MSVASGTIDAVRTAVANPDTAPVSHADVRLQHIVSSCSIGVGGRQCRR